VGFRAVLVILEKKQFPPLPGNKPQNVPPTNWTFIKIGSRDIMGAFSLSVSGRHAKASVLVDNIENGNNLVIKKKKTYTFHL
jgi:hypothetical protein